jgi:hypothetical protein
VRCQKTLCFISSVCVRESSSSLGQGQQSTATPSPPLYSIMPKVPACDLDQEQRVPIRVLYSRRRPALPLRGRAHGLPVPARERRLPFLLRLLKEAANARSHARVRACLQRRTATPLACPCAPAKLLRPCCSFRFSFVRVTSRFATI